MLTVILDKKNVVSILFVKLCAYIFWVHIGKPARLLLTG